MPSRWTTRRLFLSSTFRDMHAERDHLVRNVFPELRQKLESHRVHLDDIDLRWGVTARQVEDGRTLGLCFDLIEESRPFFACLLGERYGSVPQRLDPTVATTLGHAGDLTGKSITELEILYGALFRAGTHSRPLFFFRDPDFIETVPTTLRDALVSESEVARQKLEGLKQRISDAGLPVSRYSCRYAGMRVDRRIIRMECGARVVDALNELGTPGRVTPAEYESLGRDLQEVVASYGTLQLDGLEGFGQTFRDQVWATLSAEMALPSAPTEDAALELNALEEDDAFQDRFSESRVRIYRGRPELHTRLTRFADESNDALCLVAGPAGCGKSATLATFAANRTADDELVVTHSLEAGPRSAELHTMLQRVCAILRRRLELAVPVPDERHALIRTFRELIAQVPDTTRVLLVLDSLDRLDAEDSGLHWLPNEIPASVKILASVSAASDQAPRVTRAFEGRGCTTIAVTPLTDSDKRAILEKVPSVSAKTLDEEQVRSLLDNDATSQPLYLLVALEELRGFGSFEHLSRRIASLPRGARAIVDLLSQVMDRLEEELEPQLVSRTLGWLALARHGLSEEELLQLHQAAGTQEPKGLHIVLRQIRPLIFRHRSRVAIAYDALRQCVSERFLSEHDARPRFHEELARLFEERLSFDGGVVVGPARELREVSYHLDRVGTDPDAAKRLIALARQQLLASLYELTRDPKELGGTSALVLRAALRGGDLEAALRFGREHVSLRSFREWTSAEELFPLVPHLGPSSALWNEIRRAVVAVPTQRERVDRLIELLRHVRTPTLVDWLRSEFEQQAEEVDESQERAFLGALARHGGRFLDDALTRAEDIGLDADSGVALFNALVAEDATSGRPADERWACLLRTAGRSVESCVAVVELLVDPAKTRARLDLLPAIVERLDSPIDRLRGLAAVAHAAFRLGDPEMAERLAKSCLALVPAAAEAAPKRTLIGADVADAGARLAAATAPFASLWPEASRAAENLVASNPGLASRAMITAGFLRATPWIGDREERRAWLDRYVARIAEVAEEDTDEGLPEAAERLLAILGGKSPEEIRGDAILDAAVEIFEHADRSLVEEEDGEIVVQLLLAVASLHRGGDSRVILRMFERVLIALSGAGSPQVSAFVFDAFFQVSSGLKMMGNRSVSMIETGLVETAKRMGYRESVALIDFVAERLLSTWSPHQPRTPAAVAIILLRVIGELGRDDLLRHTEARIDGWIRGADERTRRQLEIARLSTLIAVGRTEESEAAASLLDRPALSHAETRMVARSLLGMGQRGRAVALLRRQLPASVDPGAPDFAANGTGFARELLLAGDPSGREQVLAAADLFRRGAGDFATDVRMRLLSDVHDARDPELVRELLTRAQREFLLGNAHDSEMAACWFLSLTLSAVGEVEAAAKLFKRIAKWSDSRRQETAWSAIAGVIRCQLDPMSSSVVTLPMTAIERVEDEDSAGRLACAAVRIASRLEAEGAEELLRIVIGRLDAWFDRPRALRQIAGEILNGLDMLPRPRAAGARIDLLETLTSGRTQDGEWVLSSLSDFPARLLASTGRDPQPLVRELELALDAASRSDRRRCEARERVATLAAARLPLEDARRVVDKALSAERDDDGDAASLSASIVVAVLSSERRERDLVLRPVLAELEERATDREFVARATVLGPLERDRAFDERARRLAEQIRSDGPPSSLVRRVAWVAALTDTSLDLLARTTATVLETESVGFFESYDTLRALEVFLPTRVTQLPVEQTRQWVGAWLDRIAAMPLVHKEESRHFAYRSLLSAVSTVTAELKAEVQTLVVRKVFSDLERFALESVVEGLVDCRLEERPARLAMELWLEGSDRRGDGLSSAQQVLRFAILCLKSKGAADDHMLTTIEARLDVDQAKLYEVEPRHVAAAAARCPRPSLADLLRRVFLAVIRAEGGAWAWYADEFAAVAPLPDDWWVEHLEEIQGAGAIRTYLLDWIERRAGDDPERAATSIALATAWSEDPRALSLLWLDAATSRAPIPDSVRLEIARALETAEPPPKDGE